MAEIVCASLVESGEAEGELSGRGPKVSMIRSEMCNHGVRPSPMPRFALVTRQLGPWVMQSAADHEYSVLTGSGKYQK